MHLVLSSGRCGGTDRNFRSSSRGLVVVVPLLIVLVAVFHLFGDRFTTQGDLFVPLPDHHITELQFSGSPGEAEQLLAVLTQGEAEQKPLSTAGFVAHRRYQRSLLYGGAYEVPSAGEAVGLTRFRRAGDRIETWEEEVLRFDGEWVLNEFDVPDDSAYSLFVREGGAFFVRWESLGSVLLTRQSMIAQILLLFAFLIPLFTPFGLPYRTGLGTVAVASRSAAPLSILVQNVWVSALYRNIHLSKTDSGTPQSRPAAYYRCSSMRGDY